MGYRLTSTFTYGPYKVETYGYGAARAITDTRDGYSLFFQGDDALQLDNEFMLAELAERPLEDVIADYRHVFEAPR